MTDKNQMLGTTVVSAISGLAVNLFVALLFAVSWNLGPAQVGLPSLEISQGIALFSCLFLGLFWPLYIASLVIWNLARTTLAATLNTMTVKTVGTSDINERNNKEE
jgi:hypothetical protein